MEPLNAKGVRLLVTLLRYVEQHGNVTWKAKEAARLLRAVAGDYAKVKVDERHRIVFEGETKTPQEDLAVALVAVRVLAETRAASKRGADEAQGKED